MAASREPTRSPARRLELRVAAAYTLLVAFVAASLAFALLVYLPLTIDFCAVDPEEPQCVETDSHPAWPTVLRWALWIGAAVACASTVAFAHRSSTDRCERRRFAVSAAVAVGLIAATGAAAYPLIEMV